MDWRLVRNGLLPYEVQRLLSVDAGLVISMGASCIVCSVFIARELRCLWSWSLNISVLEVEQVSKYECTMDHEPFCYRVAGGYSGWRADVACALTRCKHFSAQNDVMAAILKLWRQIKHSTQSIDAYLLREHSCQISSRSDLKRRSLRLFWRGRFNKNNKKKNKTSSDMRSGPGPQMTNTILVITLDRPVRQTSVQ